VTAAAAHAELVARTQHLFPGATVESEWTYEDGRRAFCQWIHPQVAHLPPRERLEELVRLLYLVIAMHEDDRVHLWACRLQDELIALQEGSRS
jgi:hypothetical protein